MIMHIGESQLRGLDISKNCPDLSHSCVGLMMANGVAIERIRDWVGHRDIRTTVNTYGYLEYQSKKETAVAIQNSLPLKMAVAVNP